MPRVEKTRSTMEMFIRHLIYDVLAKKTIDKVLRLLRKLDWNDPSVSLMFSQRDLELNAVGVFRYMQHFCGFSPNHGRSSIAMLAFWLCWPMIFNVIIPSSRSGLWTRFWKTSVLEWRYAWVYCSLFFCIYVANLCEAKHLQKQPTKGRNSKIPRRTLHVSTDQLGVDIRYSMVFSYLWTS